MSLLGREDYPSLSDLIVVGLMFLLLFGITLVSEYSLNMFYYSKIAIRDLTTLIAGFLSSAVFIGTFTLVFLAFEDSFRSKRDLKKKFDRQTEEEYG